MALVSCERCRGYPKSTRKLQGRGTLAQVKSAHKDRFDITVNSENDIGDILIDLLPFAVGDVFVGGATDVPIILTEISTDRDDKVRNRWYADVTYEEAVAADVPQPGTAPDLLTPEWSWSGETINKSWFIDSDGNQIATSAGEKMSLDMPFAIPVLNIERYESFFDPSTILDYMNHVNSAPFWGADAGQVLCSAIEDRKDTHVIFGNQYYRKVKYVFKFALPFIEEVLEGWTDVLIDHGTYYKNSQGDKIHFKAGGSETTGNLDGSGGKAAEGVYFIRRFYRFPEADFNTLNLGPF